MMQVSVEWTIWHLHFESSSSRNACTDPCTLQVNLLMNHMFQLVCSLNLKLFNVHCICWHNKNKTIALKISDVMKNKSNFTINKRYKLACIICKHKADNKFGIIYILQMLFTYVKIMAGPAQSTLLLELLRAKLLQKIMRKKTWIKQY